MRANDFNIDELSLTSVEIEELVSKDFKRNSKIALPKQPFSTKSLIVPRGNSTARYTLSMTDWAHPDKVLLYKAMIAAYNYAFFDKSASISAKGTVSVAARHFIEWLNVHQVDNRYEILKRYETERMDATGNHGGQSPLLRVITTLNYALDSVEFQAEVSVDDYRFLTELNKTKVSPNLNKKQISLASYFGELDWLRREDIGVGRKLYSTIASPKLTINSLSLTAATIILEMSKYKSVLMSLIKKASPEISVWIDVDYSLMSKWKRSECIGNALYLLISAYHQNANKFLHGKNALNALLISNSSTENAYRLSLNSLNSQESCDNVFLTGIGNKRKVNSEFCGKNITSVSTGCLFSLRVLRSLFHGDTKIVTNIENLMFGWLMASLAVQPSDISKLTLQSFRKIRVGGRISQVECEYFKGRAKVFHTTRSLSSREIEGMALLTYLDLMSDSSSLYNHSNLTVGGKMRSITGTFKYLLQSEGINNSLRTMHSKRNIPYVVPSVYCALTESGIHLQNVVPNAQKTPKEDRLKLVKNSKSPCQVSLFGLMAIKNSAVHALSDPYTYHYLINRNSHTNKTEKVSYLTEDNEEWMNSSGRITREVMQDLIQNVFDLGYSREQRDRVAAFNSEFMVVSEGISYKAEDMNKRLRLVTGEVKGKVDEVGVLSLSVKNDDEPLSPIYVLDSPLTVLRMHNYLHEFNKNYKKLLTANPEFLFKTVMPTVEWMENTLNKMSKKSQQLGREQFDEMVKNGVVMSVFHSI
ncbi:hypothetical protein [Vibrio parahaemolyticus]|uniref:hypothetical protein n=1 Tax=Vibrio parahaemolyticus TaxID=670 RepID=UPI003873218F